MAGTVLVESLQLLSSTKGVSHWLLQVTSSLLVLVCNEQPMRNQTRFFLEIRTFIQIPVCKGMLRTHFSALTEKFTEKISGENAACITKI